jgi:hypothetical protein
LSLEEGSYRLNDLEHRVKGSPKSPDDVLGNPGHIRALNNLADALGQGSELQLVVRDRGGRDSYSL